MYIKSSRGGDKFIADGYMYIYDKTSTDGKIKFWRCEFKSDRCRARLHTSVDTNEVLKKLNDHKHEPDPQRIIASQMRHLLKRKQDAESPIPMIKAEIMDVPERDCPSTYQHIMYIKEEPECKMSREENEPSDIESSTLVTAIDYIDIPKGLKLYDVGRGRRIKFLLDDCNGTNEILIFAREDYKEWTQFMKTIYIDSTFKKCPYMFSQICIITAERNGYAFGVMYILLQDRKDETYRNLFRRIKNLWPNFSPEVIHTDYTRTSYVALRKEFPSAEIHGSFFLMKDAFLERIDECQLQYKYNNDMEFALQAKMILGLSFVPKKDAERAANMLRNRLPRDLLQMLDWFEETFVGRVSGDILDKNVSQSTQHPFEMWSVYNKVATGEYYTNNGIEIASKHAHIELESEHMLLPQFIIGFQAIQRTTDTLYEAFLKGETPVTKNVQSRLMHLVKTYDQRTMYEYLRGVAANIY